MPKNKKPAGGRAHDFEPRYGASAGSYQDRKRRPAPADRDAPRRPGDASAGTPGSKSPNHRGHRAEQDAAPKRRWTAQEKAGRDRANAAGKAHADRPRRDDDRPRRGYGDRPQRDGAPRREYGDRPQRDGAPRREYGNRPQRGYGDRPQRADDRARRDHGDRPQYGERPRRDDAPRRTYDDRPRREYADRAPRTDDRPRRDDRPQYGDRPRRDDRPQYGDRPRRDDAPRRTYDDRPRRDYADRAPRTDDRPRRDDRSPYGDRPRRDDRPPYGDRPRRDDAPRRTYDDRPRRDDRPQHGDRPRRDDAPRRTYDDRAPRDYADRAPRTGDRPRRDDAPRRTYDDRPTRSDWSERPAPTHDAHVDVVHERLQAEAVQVDEVADRGFAELGLGQNIVTALAELGAAHPFPIQAATIPAILEGRDVLGRGRTGSGKTIAFGAPLVESVLRSQAGQKREFGRAPKALVLAPTRELALQIDRTVQPIARSVGIFTTQIYGGVPQARQVGALRKGVDVVIGTPGRIEDLIEQGKLDLSEVRIVVLDEADHMSELGFLEPMQRILRLVADGAQKLLFSATLDREVAALVDEFLVDPAVYEVAGEDQESGTIDHRVLVIDHRDKAEILGALADREGKTLVFARTRAFAEMLAEQFDDAGIRAIALHGDLNQAKRTRNLQRMTEGKVNVLVATDVAARGIHVDDIDLVIQADAPDEFKAYLHRSGRTGRAGRSGTVVTLVTRQRRRRMTELLQRAQIVAPFDEVRPGDELIEQLRRG